MNRLVKIIGNAPSEISYEALLERLKIERVRVSASLDMFKTTPSRRVAVRTAAKPKTSNGIPQKIIDACKAANITIDEFLETQRQLKGEQ
jgi:hypothetical protein